MSMTEARAKKTVSNCEVTVICDVKLYPKRYHGLGLAFLSMSGKRTSQPVHAEQKGGFVYLYRLEGD
jgi:hypothetical protein